MGRWLFLGLLAGGATAQYGESAAAEAYERPQVAVAEYTGVLAEDHIHPGCSSGGVAIRAESAEYAGAMGHEERGGYRRLNSKVSHRKLEDYIESTKRTLFEDDLEEPYDDPGCGHGVCVMTLGRKLECICDAGFMTTPDSGPCEQHQKSQGVAFILQLFLGFFGAGCFYLGGSWLASAWVCLLFGAFAFCVAPVVACVTQGLFRPCCGDQADKCCPKIPPATAACCFGFLQCVGAIVWLVSLVEIGSDCHVDGIPCIPM